MTQEQIDKLDELKKLLDAGILTQEEMQTEKAKILGTADIESKKEQESSLNKPNVTPVEPTQQVPAVNDIRQTEILTPNHNTAETGEETEPTKPQSRKYIFAAIAGLLVLLLIYVVSSSRNSSQPEFDAAYMSADNSSSSSTDEIVERVTNFDDNNSANETIEADDDEFAFDPWNCDLVLNGDIYRTCNTRAYLRLSKTTKDNYEGVLEILLGEAEDDSRFIQEKGELNGKVRGKSDGNSITIVMDSYSTKPGDMENYFDGTNIRGQIFRITYNGSSYEAKAVGSMESFFDGGDIRVSK